MVGGSGPNILAWLLEVPAAGAKDGPLQGASSRAGSAGLPQKRASRSSVGGMRSYRRWPWRRPNARHVLGDLCAGGAVEGAADPSAVDDDRGVHVDGPGNSGEARQASLMGEREDCAQ